MHKLVTCLFLAASALSAQSTTTYTLPQQACVQIANCIIYGPGENYSLWTTPGWSIFDVNSWANGFQTLDTYHCYSQTYSSGPGTTGIVIVAGCTGTDTKGVPFAMSYTVNAYSYVVRVGSGRGGGGVGTRWMVTGGTVSITQ